MVTIEDTLKELDRWYNELPGGTERPRLLSKLAMLEFCGWLEIRFDDVVSEVGVIVGVDAAWLQKDVLGRTFGFAYADHLRKMLCQIVGEAGVGKLEGAFEVAHPGKLDELKSVLGTLWKSRGVLAHTHASAPVTRQEILNAPSWSLNQQRVVGKAIALFEGVILSELAKNKV